MKETRETSQPAFEAAKRPPSSLLSRAVLASDTVAAPFDDLAAIERRTALEQSWLQLTRVTLPGLFASYGSPVREDHCFQRILLDAVCGGVWYDHVKGRPAYRRIEIERLAAAVALGQRIATGAENLRALNARSLAWRRERKGKCVD